MAIDSDGQVLSWGWNARATLGHGHRSAAQSCTSALPLTPSKALTMPVYSISHQQVPQCTGMALMGKGFSYS